MKFLPFSTALVIFKAPNNTGAQRNASMMFLMQPMTLHSLMLHPMHGALMLRSVKAARSEEIFEPMATQIALRPSSSRGGFVWSQLTGEWTLL